MNNDGENNAEDDFYAFLNVPRDASSDDIRNSFKSLSRQFHPDKHTNPEIKRHAGLMFDKLKKVYDVLSDPSKRAVYDTLGPSGLDREGWALVERKFKSSQEIREEYEKMRKEAEERRMQQRTNPRGSITVLVDATDMFEHELDEDDEEDESYSSSFFIPSLEVRSMTISQSIDAPLTSADNVNLSGTINVRNGIGSGTVATSLRHIFSPVMWTELELGAGNGPVVSLKAFRTLTPDLHGQIQTFFHLTPSGIRPGFTTMLTRQFSKNFIGYMSYKAGVDSSLSTVTVYENEFCRVHGSIQFGLRHSFISSSYTHKFKEKDTRVKVGLKYGTLGAIMEYGCETRMSQHSIVGAAMTLGTSTGVSLRLKLQRNNQSYIFPILLSEELLPSSTFYGTVVPLLGYYVIKTLVIDPYLKRREEQEREVMKESRSSELEERRKSSMAYVELMRDTYVKIVERERNASGLVIEQALYGDESRVLQHENDSRAIPPEEWCFDCTVALQVMVTEESRLTLAPVSKSYLPGFFDPHLGAPKKLLVRYRFGNQTYRVLLDENEPASLPSLRHQTSGS